MQFGIQSGLPQYPAGLKDAEAALVLPLYRAIHGLASQVSVATGNVTYDAGELSGLDRAQGLTAGVAQKLAIVAGEALAYGNMLSLSVSGGNIIAVKADAGDVAKPALAVLDTDGGLASSQVGTALFLTGRTRGISGTVFGATYYLGTAGTVTGTAPSGDNVIRQVVGVGLGSAGFYAGITPVGKVVFSMYKPSAGVLRVQYTDGSHTDHVV